MRSTIEQVRHVRFAVGDGKTPPGFASSRQDDFRGGILAATGWRRIKRSRRMLSHVSTLMLRPYDKLVANLKHGGALLDRARLGEQAGSRLEAMLFRKAQFSLSWVTGARPYASRTGFSDRLPAARDCGAHPPDDKRHHPFAAGRVPSTPTRSPDHTGQPTPDDRQRRALDRPQGRKRALPSVRAERVRGHLKIAPRAVPVRVRAAEAKFSDRLLGLLAKGNKKPRLCQELRLVSFCE